MKHIKIIDTGEDRYIIQTDSTILGRMFENKAEKLLIDRPECEAQSNCVMLVLTMSDKIVNAIRVTDEPIDITSVFTQYRYIRLAFRFIRPDGYEKASEKKKFEFLDAPKPTGFIPQYGNLNFDIYHVKQVIDGNTCELVITDNGEGETLLVGQLFEDNETSLYLVQE